MTIDHHVSSEAQTPADWIDASYAATCEMVALLAARAGVPLDIDDGALATTLLAGIVTDTATFAHPNATPADAAHRRRAHGGRRAAERAVAPLLPHQAHRPAAPLRARPRPAPGDARGRVVWSTLLDDDLLATGAAPARTRRASSTCLRRPRPPRSRSCSRRPAPATRVSVRTKPGGVDATELTGLVRRRRPRACRRARRSGIRSTRRSRRVLAEAERLAAARSPVAQARAGTRLDGVLVAAKPPGPTSHDVVALVRRLSGDASRRPRRHARPVRVGRPAALPRAGDTPRRVPPRRREAIPRDGLLRGDLDDRRPRRRADAGRRRRRPSREAVEAALEGFRGTIEQVPPAYSAVKVAGRRAYAMARGRRAAGARRRAR